MRVTTKGVKSCVPEPRPCEHCGSMREPITVPSPVRMAGRAVGEPLLVGWERCGCEGAVAERVARDAAKAAEDAEARRRLRDARVAKAGIKERYHDAMHPDADAYADALCAGRSLFFKGGFGTGKTHLASAIALRLVDRSVDALILSSIELTMELQSTYGSSRSSELEVIERLCRRKVLMVDDLGKEPPTDYALSRMFDLVYRRYEAKAPMVVTANYSFDELIDRLGRRGDYDNAIGIVSRLKQMCKVVPVDGEDRRRTLSDWDGVSAQGCEDGGSR